VLPAACCTLPGACLTRHTSPVAPDKMKIAVCLCFRTHVPSA
jgi:hypothetical protein